MVVVMTDGRDEDNAGKGPGSTHTLPEVLKLVKDSGAMVYAIGLGLNPDKAVLQQMADLSGGRAFFPADVAGSAVRVPARDRRPSTALRPRLHVDAHSARRQLAQGGDPHQERSERDDPNGGRLLRPGEVRTG